MDRKIYSMIKGDFRALTDRAHSSILFDTVSVNINAIRLGLGKKFQTHLTKGSIQIPTRRV